MKLKMLCTCGPHSADTSPILDVEKVIQDYAWREFRRLHPWLSNVLIRRNDYVIDVQWNFFEFDHHTTRFEPRSGIKEGFTEKKKAELHATNFKNDTAVEQTYRFKIQRQTKATTSVTYQRGYTIKGNANFKLNIPSVIGDCGVSAGVDGQLTITKSKGETFEEVFNWETDSEITVEKNHVTTAKMLLTEDEMVADFEVKTLLKMPSGEAPIIIRRRRDNEIQAVCLITNLSDVFEAYQEELLVEIVRVKLAQKEIRHDIRLTTTGVIRSVRWRDQRISLESHRLAGRGRDEEHIFDTPNPDLVDLNAREIYAQVIKHVTDSKSSRTEPFPSAHAHTEPKAIQAAGNTETRLIRLPTIPTIVTELPSDSEENGPLTSGSKSLDLSFLSNFQEEEDTSRGAAGKPRKSEDKPRLERGKHCVDGNSPPGERAPTTTLLTLQERRAKLAKVTSV